MPDVIIIGAGISGLSCAWTLKKLGIDAMVLEASSRAGGVIRTEHVNGYQIETGPNTLQAAPAALKIVDEAGLWDDLLAATPNSPRFVYWNGKLRKFPFGPLGFGGLARVFAEPFIRSKSPKDESVRDFFVRRMGPQAHDRLVAPALTGIYAANTANLSMASVFPSMIRMEQEYGSLAGAFLRTLAGSRKSAPAAARPKPKGAIFSFPAGMEALPRRLSENLNIKYGVHDARVGEAPVTVVTVPAYRAEGVFGNRFPALAALLVGVQYAPMVIAAVSLPEHTFKEPLHGFGFLVDRHQGLHLLGALFSSALFPGRAPKGHALLTSFVGGMFEPEAIDWPDARVWETVCPELQRVLETSEAPEPVALFRHRQAIPQYNIGHGRWVESVKKELTQAPGLFMSANYLEGVSVHGCIEQGEQTANAVAEYLRRKA